MHKYLPSKQFTARILIVIIIACFVFGVYEITKLFKGSNSNQTPTRLLVKDLIQKDSNNNGIADWEEGLWGLDPTKNGDSNKTFILSKRALLAKDNATSTDGGSTSPENDALSQELLATILSLQQSGSLNDASINSVSDAIGQNIVPSDIPDIYTRDMLNIGGTEKAYYLAFKNLVTKYQDKNMGSELNFLAQGIENKDPQGVSLAISEAVFYREFSQELIKTPVPASLASTNLSLANNYEKVAESIEGFTNVLTDQMTAMKSIISYKKYSDATVSDITKLSDNLKNK